MSFVDLLFPQAELEALGNKWHEPAPKRRRLESGSAQVLNGSVGAQRWQGSENGSGQRRHRLSTPTSYQYGRQSALPKDTSARYTKRSNSESQTLISSTSSTSTQCKPKPTPTPTPTTSKSCLPSFIEPSLLKNYLRHLHPKDSHRYTVPNSASSNSHATEDAASSPGSLILDSTPSPASTDNCPTPAAICEQFRSGPFGHLFDGMRLTDNERDLMEDLLSPATPLPQDAVSGHKRKQADVQVELAPEDYFNIDESLLQRMFPTFADKGNQGLGVESMRSIKIEQDCDVHSSGLSPAAEEEEDEERATSHRGIVVYDYDALSVDDFFDLDEAST